MGPSCGGGGGGSLTLLKPYISLQNKAVVRILGAFKGSPSRALEVEGAIPPPQARLENACNSYSLRLLAFQGNHPVLQALYRPVRDELATSSESDQALSSYL